MARTPAGTPPNPKGAERFLEEKATYTVRGSSQPDIEAGVAANWFDFRFSEYAVDGTSFADNQLPGIPKQQYQGYVTWRPGRYFVSSSTASAL